MERRQHLSAKTSFHDQGSLFLKGDILMIYLRVRCTYSTIPDFLLMYKRAVFRNLESCFTQCYVVSAMTYCRFLGHRSSFIGLYFMLGPVRFLSRMKLWIRRPTALSKVWRLSSRIPNSPPFRVMELEAKPRDSSNVRFYFVDDLPSACFSNSRFHHPGRFPSPFQSSTL
jgi:hypothetical protein